MLMIQTQSRPLRCAYCHDGVDPGEACCSRCQTLCHTDCMKLAGGCPTYGCEGGAPSRGRRRAREAAPARTFWSKALPWILCFGGIAVIAGIATPNLTNCRKNGNETSAIGALKTIGTAQSLFREADKDRDGVLDYAASLEQLGPSGDREGGQGLIDSVLASGKKNGYRFRVIRSSVAPEFCWAALATPFDPEADRIFFANHEGIIWYRHRSSSDGPTVIVIDSAVGAVPQGFKPVGR